MYVQAYQVFHSLTTHVYHSLLAMLEGSVTLQLLMTVAPMTLMPPTTVYAKLVY